MPVNTPFTPNADFTAQLTGSGVAIGNAVSPTFSATIALTSILQGTRFVRILGSNTTSSTVSLTTAFVANPGALLVVQVNADASGTVTATFSTGFKATGTLAPTSSTRMLILFASDGTTWNEVARTGSALS